MSDALQEIEENFKAQTARIRADLDKNDIAKKPETTPRFRYRVKVIEHGQDNVEYIPQYRFWIFWFSFEERGKVVRFGNALKANQYVEYRKRLRENGRVRYISYR